MPYRVAIVTTHPIQYQVPWFRALAAHSEIDLTIFYCMLPNATLQGDGFGVAFEWDLPLLDGYRYEVLNNIARHPSLTTFRGCDTPELYEKICRDCYDAVIVNGWVAKSCLQALVACRRAGVPCIVRGESNVLRQRAWWTRMIHWGLLRQYSAFLVIGASNAEFYQSYGIGQERLFPGRYCVDNDRFAESAQRLEVCRSELRQMWGIDHEVPVFLYCGKFVEKKHPMKLIHAATRARSQGARFHLLMVGDGELRHDCEKFACEQHLPVTFSGFLNQSRLPEAYIAADCLVLPSDAGETWGLVVNEAMACGRPAVVSDRVGCARDLIREGVTGEIFAFADDCQLADALIRLSADKAGLERMGSAARRHVDSYSIAALTQGTLKCLQFVCQSNHRTATNGVSHA